MKARDGRTARNHLGCEQGRLDAVPLAIGDSVLEVTDAQAEDLRRQLGDPLGVVPATHLRYDLEPMWAADQAAAYLNLEVECVRKAAARGEIPGKKIGKYWRFIPAHLCGWRESR